MYDSQIGELDQEIACRLDVQSEPDPDDPAPSDGGPTSEPPASQPSSNPALSQAEWYCQFKVEQSHKELIALHHQGVATLWTGLLVAVICLVLAFAFTLMAQSGSLPIKY